jgi:S-adenosyl methyltransferase
MTPAVLSEFLPGARLIHARDLLRSAHRRGRPTRDDDVMRERDPEQSVPGDRPDAATGVADITRMQSYWRGGTDGSAVDERAARDAAAAYPGLAASVRANRAFLARSVRYLAGECGLRQFLDIGTGLPAPGSTREVAREVASGCRVVYCDNDAAVVRRARAELAHDPDARVGTARADYARADYVEADVRDTGGLLRRAAPPLDLSQPVAVLLVSVLHMIEDHDDPQAVVARLMAALPAGSYLVLTHVASDIDADAIAEMTRRVNRQVARRATPRDHAAVLRFFTGLELVPPGLVVVPRWRPDSAEEAASPSAQWGGVARRP